MKVGNRGWIQRSSLMGLWRAVTPAGLVTHHATSLSAMEALLCAA
jgi:hypothetical protein